jgi:hypothetical protein
MTADTHRITRFPIDVDAIAARAEAAPGGCWVAFPDSLWIPWAATTDDESYGTWDAGRYLAIPENEWHTGSDNPPPDLWAFLATARDDVLSLAAEVRRLRAALATARAQAPERAA